MKWHEDMRMRATVGIITIMNIACAMSLIFLSLTAHSITPITYSSGTSRQYRESAELTTLSPAMK